MPKCRTCLSDEALTEIFTICSENQLLKITGIQIQANDGMSQNICTQCIKLVETFIQFREQCSITQKLLQIDKKWDNLQDLNLKEKDAMEENVIDDDDDIKNSLHSDSDNDLMNYFLTRRDKIKGKNKFHKKSKSIVIKAKDLHPNNESQDFSIKKQIDFDMNEDITQYFSSPDCERNKIRINKEKYVNNSLSSKEHTKRFKNKLSRDKYIIKGLKISKKNLKSAKGNVLIYKILDNELENSLKTPYFPCKNPSGVSSVYKTVDFRLLNNMKLNNILNVPNDMANEPNDMEIEPKDIVNEPNDIVNESKKQCIDSTSLTHQKQKRVEKLWMLAIKPINREGLVKCNMCQKEFKYKNFLKHANSHFDPGFTCEMCGVTFVSVHAMRTHQQRRHGAPRGHACALCDYRAVARIELANHQNRYHTGERPYICDVCGDSFYQRSTLVQHMRKHYGVKKFKCEFCPKMFASRSQVAGHRAKFHIYRYSYFCYVCSYQSTCRSTVRNHIVKVHSIPRNEQTALKYVKEIR